MAFTINVASTRCSVGSFPPYKRLPQGRGWQQHCTVAALLAWTAAALHEHLPQQRGSARRALM